MKTHLRFLLVLVSMIFVLGGCQNPAGPEIPVVETPEDNDNKTKVEFRWCTKRVISDIPDAEELLEIYSPMYFLDLHFNSELKDYAYGIPEGYDLDSYLELLNSEDFEKFSDDTFEKVFGTKYYEEGTVIDLEEWTYKATDLVDKVYAIRLYFLTKDFDGTNTSNIEENDFDKIIVGNEDIIVYVLGEFRMSVQSGWYGY